ncbi:MAG: MAPEG family protein [Pseudomonadota bacterium]
MTITEFLSPVLALIAWSMVMLLWLYATRIPAMQKAGIDPQEAADTKGDWKAKLPKGSNSPAENYNHLMEQPTVFYALMLFAAATGGQSSLLNMLAWGYVGLRVVHSLVQATFNRVMVRFALFLTSSIVLMVMTVLEVMRVFLS